MDGNYYQNPNFNNNDSIVKNSNEERFYQTLEHNYLEDLLKKNHGKVIKAYFNFLENKDNSNKMFTGVIEGVGQGHLVIKDPSNGKWYLILLYYLNYIEFEEAIN